MGFQPATASILGLRPRGWRLETGKPRICCRLFNFKFLVSLAVRCAVSLGFGIFNLISSFPTFLWPEGRAERKGGESQRK